MSRFVVYALIVSLTGSPICLAQSSGVTPETLKNVELTSEGTLQGQLVTDSGVSVAQAPVKLTIKGQVWSAVTDSSGRFEISDVRGGRGLLQVGEDYFPCQLWTAGTAPPNSIRSVGLVQSGGSQVRGQNLGQRTYVATRNRILGMSGKQLVVAGLVIAGVTVGIAAAASDDDAS